VKWENGEKENEREEKKEGREGGVVADQTLARESVSRDCGRQDYLFCMPKELSITVQRQSPRSCWIVTNLVSVVQVVLPIYCGNRHCT